MLRVLVFCCGAALIVIGIWLGLAEQIWIGGAWVAFFGALIVFGLFFEPRYRARKKSESAQPTGERFIDPTTGRRTQVFYDPDTGERSYQPEK